jgi:6-phosphogluconate dehydrogenase
MVHNGIEYADMQLIAEAYDLIKQGTWASAPEIAKIFQTWNEGDLESFLIEITAEVLAHTDAGDWQTVCRHRPGSSRAEGHWALDGPERS